MEKSAPEIRGRIEASPVLPFKGVPFAAQPVKPGWESGAVSGIAVDRNGTIYEIQRGERADPIVVLDRNGIVLRSWGKGDFKIPHSIRIDPVGNVWTVDAGSSKVIEYSPLGKKLMTINVGDSRTMAAHLTALRTWPLLLMLTSLSPMATATREFLNTRRRAIE